MLDHESNKKNKTATTTKKTADNKLYFMHGRHIIKVYTKQLLLLYAACAALAQHKPIPS